MECACTVHPHHIASHGKHKRFAHCQSSQVREEYRGVYKDHEKPRRRSPNAKVQWSDRAISPAGACRQDRVTKPPGASNGTERCRLSSLLLFGCSSFFWLTGHCSKDHSPKKNPDG